MGKDFIDEFIPSKDTRAYLRSIHHEFTDLEKAIIVTNHIMISYEKKVKWLNEFMDEISDDALKDRISKALFQIKRDRKYYRKSNTALGALPYNESLFDFIFIPHDFRHGDIVRSIYGDWDTTVFGEKVGIILNYFDKDYDFYKNLRGDYSDVQVCVDIKFDGVEYQGEFKHEHINPIYIERIRDQRYKQLFDEICDYKEIRDTLNGENVKLILCHYPILMWKEQHYGSILLYGHVHNSVEEYYFKKCLREMNTEEFFDRIRGDKVLRAYNVGCMLPYMNYEPRTLEEIVMESERLCNEQKL